MDAVLNLVFDATRLLSRARFATPTGIDRVDLVYARALRAAPGIRTALMAFDALGAYRLNAAAAERLLDDTAQRWQFAAPRRSAAFEALSAWLNSVPGTAAPASNARAESGRPDFSSIGRLRYGALERAPADERQAIYVNTSHGRLFQPGVARWLQRRERQSVFFVHDLIPIEHPEFNRAREAARHAQRLRLIAAQARLVIVNSEATRTALLRWWQSERLRLPTIAVIPLGVTDEFCSAPVPPSISSLPVPYFVVLGTIEPRKNHALLLHLWRRLAEQEDSGSPRLLVIGRRGWENQTTFTLLDRTPALRPLVAEATGLADAEIAELLRGACALLAPSFAEGYGLPVAEALACGTPVIASDLPAHREVGGRWIETLDPLDGPGWLAAIRAHALINSPQRLARVAALATYRAPSWPDHAEAAIAAIRNVAASAKPSGKH